MGTSLDGLGVEFTHKTVGDAFYALTAEWGCFELRDGSGMKEWANKRLVGAGEAIPEALWEIYRAETDTKATKTGTFDKSSESTDGGQ